MNGFDKVFKNLDKIEKKINKKTEKAIKEVGQDLLKESNLLTPMSPISSGTSGDLRRSGKVTYGGRGSNFEAIVSYGDAQVDYAAAVHEMPTSNNFTQAGTGSNYLQGPLLANKKKWAKHIAKAVDL